MSWALRLYDLYEKNKHLVGEYINISGNKNQETMLFPIYHTTVNAQIEIVIDKDGNFKKAEFLSKKMVDEKGIPKGKMFIPCTEKSANRTSGIEPMPLFDKLIYIAKDYSTFVDKKDNTKYYEAYIQQLEELCNSEYFSDNIKIYLNAIYKYIENGRIIRDLINYEVLDMNEDHKINGFKKDNINQEDFFVRFIIEEDIAKYMKLWTNKEFQEGFINYQNSKAQIIDLCYITGERKPISKLSIGKIRNEGDKAKLISSNDSSNFVYRGRFNTKNEETGYNEALAVGNETSQKMLNALRWIIKGQGYTRDGMCMVTWVSNLTEKVPESYFSIKEIPDEAYLDSEDEFLKKLNTSIHVDHVSIRKLINGILSNVNVNENSNIYIMSFDSALDGKGRLSMTYYKEIYASKYLKNIGEWHETCCWKYVFFKENEDEKKAGKRTLYGAPSFKEIALCLYGTEQNGMLALRKDKQKVPMLKYTMDKLRPCVIDRKRIPLDIVRTAVNRASNPLGYETKNYKRILNVACAIVNRYNWDNYRLKNNKSNYYNGKNEENQKIVQVKLDESLRDRSYLYGRLLAIAEDIEETKFKDEERETNSQRYMYSFYNRPYETWKIIRNKIQVYLNNFPVGQRAYYKKKMAIVENLFEPGDYNRQEPLSGMYLIGYSLQKSSDKEMKQDLKDIEINLDENSKDRSYLYGRLLAVAETIESNIIEKNRKSKINQGSQPDSEKEKNKKDKRSTNVEKYMCEFSNRPFETWGIIRKKMQVYLNSCLHEKENNSKKEEKSCKKIFTYIENKDDYKKIFADIENNFELEDFKSNKPLTSMYILGYDLQRLKLTQIIKNKEKFQFKSGKVNVNEDLKDRSYLYGRLMAYADYIEYSKMNGKTERPTNAEVYLSNLQKLPISTWEFVRKKIEIYIKLIEEECKKEKKVDKEKERKKKEEYKKILSDFKNLESLINENVNESEKSLTPMYILGYDLQNFDLYQNNETE